MICPLILKQTKKTENGLEEWEHQPCLEEACSLYFDKKKKCSLFHNSEAAQETRNILERVDFISSFQVIKAGLDALQAQQRDQLKTQQEDVEKRQETLLENLQGLSRELTENVRDHLSEQIQVLQKDFQSLPDRMDQSVRGVGERLDAMEEKLRLLADQGHRQAESAAQALTERLEAIEGQLGQTVRRGDELIGKIDDHHRSGMERMETLMGETGRLLSDLLEGTREMREYYGEEKRRQEDESVRNRKLSAREQNNRGVVYFHRGAHEAAARAFEKAVELDADYAEAYNNLGLAYSELDRPEHAVHAFEKAVSLRPELGEAFNNLGLIYYSSLDYEKATEMFSKALDEGCRDRSTAYTNYGNSLYQLQRFEDAAAAWNKALQANPLNQNAKKGLALLKHQEQEAW